MNARNNICTSSRETRKFTFCENEGRTKGGTESVKVQNLANVLKSCALAENKKKRKKERKKNE